MEGLIYTASLHEEQASNLLEQLTLDESRDGQGQIAMRTEQLEDITRLKRWYGEGTWLKMRHVRHCFEGVIAIHYFINIDTGRTVGFKFKKRLQKK